MARPSYRALRAGLVALLCADVVALAAFSVHVDRVTSTETVTPASAPAAPPLGVAPPVAPLPTGPVLVGSPEVPTQLISEGPPGSTPSPDAVPSATPTSTDTPTATNTPAAAPSTPAAPSSAPSAPTGPLPVAKSIPACPIELTKADDSGGLQSLIPFAPAFGPLEPEAFAAAAAYQPVLQLVGPILAQYPALEPVIGPSVTTFVTDFGAALTSGYSVLSPLYEPYRQQVLDDETKLAAQLAPYSEDLVDSKLGGCVVEVENALIADASGKGTPAATAPATRN